MAQSTLKPVTTAVAFVLLAAACGTGLVTHASATTEVAPSAAALLPDAEPSALEIPNFHRVDDRLFRGGQPAAGGVARLKALGVRTIINLRDEQDLVKAEEVEAQAAGLQYFSVPMYGLARPKDEQVAGILRIIDDPRNWPVFVHCRRGADRTGLIVACYRIANARWTADKAIGEADDLGMMWLEFAKRAYIRDFYAKSGSGEGVAAATLPARPSVPAPSVPGQNTAPGSEEGATRAGEFR